MIVMSDGLVVSHGSASASGSAVEARAPLDRRETHVNVGVSRFV
jgi:hypothetical protein